MISRTATFAVVSGQNLVPEGKDISNYCCVLGRYIQQLNHSLTKELAILSYILYAVLLYGVIAMAVILVNRKRDRAVLDREDAETGQLNPYGPKESRPEVNTALYQKKVEEGRAPVQTLSYVFTWILGILPAVIFATFYLGGFVGFLPLALLIILTPITIIVNAFWIYPRRIRMAEARARKNGTASRRLKNQWIGAWCVWLFYLVGTLVATGILTNIITRSLSF
jgi:hypothetical protein